ncbi:MAG: hypothetical protein R3F60_23015 [bacterium]
MRTLLLAACGLTLAACDAASDALGLDEADMGPAEVVLPQPDDQTIGELTPADNTAICEAFSAAVDRQVPHATRCAIVGIGVAGADVEADDAAQIAACTDAAHRCEQLVALGQQSLPPITFADCGLLKGDTSDCTVTIGELRACLNLMADASVGAIRQTLTCQLLDLAEVPSVDPPPPEIPEGAEECTRIRMECPGVFAEE